MWQKKFKTVESFYEYLCNRYFKRIYNYCNKLVKRQEQLIDFVEECTQTTFLEARKQISNLIKHPNVEGWLYMTARNLINNSYRSMYIKKKYEIIMDANILNSMIELNDKLEELFSSAIDVDKLSIEILSRLNKNEHELYMDYFKNNISVSELTKKHNISATAVTTRIYRLRLKIKNMTKDYFDGN